jgi:hypothetical protein
MTWDPFVQCVRGPGLSASFSRSWFMKSSWLELMFVYACAFHAYYVHRLVVILHFPV